MDERTALAILEALPPEQLEAMQAEAAKIAEQVKNAVIELAANIMESFNSLFDHIINIVSEQTPDILKAIEELSDEIEAEHKQHRRWKPVRNTIPRYHCAVRKIWPHARSCC